MASVPTSEQHRGMVGGLRDDRCAEVAWHCPAGCRRSPGCRAGRTAVWRSGGDKSDRPPAAGMTMRKGRCAIDSARTAPDARAPAAKPLCAGDHRFRNVTGNIRNLSNRDRPVNAGFGYRLARSTIEKTDVAHPRSGILVIAPGRCGAPPPADGVAVDRTVVSAGWVWAAKARSPGIRSRPATSASDAAHVASVITPWARRRRNCRTPRRFAARVGTIRPDAAAVAELEGRARSAPAAARAGPERPGAAETGAPQARALVVGGDDRGRLRRPAAMLPATASPTRSCEKPTSMSPIGVGVRSQVPPECRGSEALAPLGRMQDAGETHNAVRTAADDGAISASSRGWRKRPGPTSAGSRRFQFVW